MNGLTFINLILLVLMTFYDLLLVFTSPKYDLRLYYCYLKNYLLILFYKTIYK